MSTSPLLPQKPQQMATSGLDSAALSQDFLRYFSHTLGLDHFETSGDYLFPAFALTVRDRLNVRLNATRRAYEHQHSRRTCYLSLEYLLGRSLRNALVNLDADDEAHAALEQLGLSLENVEEAEHDAGLGNGGLGRLAA